MRNVKTWNMKICLFCLIRWVTKLKIMDIFISRLESRSKLLRGLKGQLRKMCKKESLGPTVWIALTGPMLCSLLLPGNSCLAGWRRLESSLKEEISQLLKDCLKILKKSSECSGRPMQMPWVCSTQELQLRKLTLQPQEREHQRELLMMARAVSRDIYWEISMTQDNKISLTFLWANWSQGRTQPKGSSTQALTQFGSYSSRYYFS